MVSVVPVHDALTTPVAKLSALVVLMTVDSRSAKLDSEDSSEMCNSSVEVAETVGAAALGAVALVVASVVGSLQISDDYIEAVPGAGSPVGDDGCVCVCGQRERLYTSQLVIFAGHSFALHAVHVVGVSVCHSYV